MADNDVNAAAETIRYFIGEAVDPEQIRAEAALDALVAEVEQLRALDRDYSAPYREEIAQLTAQAEQLRAERDDLRHALDLQNTDAANLRAERDAAREALNAD